MSMSLGAGIVIGFIICSLATVLLARMADKWDQE